MANERTSVKNRMAEYISHETFEQAHFLYSTRSVEETVRVMKKLGLERVARIALYGSNMDYALFH